MSRQLIVVKVVLDDGSTKTIRVCYLWMFVCVLFLFVFIFVFVVFSVNLLPP